MEEDRTIEDIPEFSILAVRALFAVIWIAVTAVVTFSSEKQYTAPLSYPSSGPIQGVEETFDERRLHVYYGVPYMRPALLQNRFQQLPNLQRPWPFLLDASQPPNMCSQPSINVGKMTLDYRNSSEDCLYLNIYVPARKSSDSVPKHPIILVVHGGSYYYGSNSFPFYNGKYLAAHGNAMVVVPNYRLGVFGFLRSNVLKVPGNQGLSDVDRALRWVVNNAAAFGGDVHSVTLMGHQVGAALIGLLHTIAGASELFHRAIMMSGSPYMRHLRGDRKARATERQEFVRKLGCTDPPTALDCLRSKTPQALLDFATKPAGWKTLYIPSQYEDIEEDASVDLKNAAAPKNLIIGATANEGSYYANLFLEKFSKYDVSKLSRAEALNYLREMIKELGVHQFDDLVAYYNEKYKDESVEAVFANAIGDIVVNCPMKQFARHTSSVQTKVFMYVFDQKPSYSTSRLKGAGHYDDIFLSLGYALETSSGAMNVTNAEKELSKELLRAWSRFADHGDPGALLNVTWPQFTKGEGVYLNIGTKPTRASRFREDDCDKVARALFRSAA
ncbi:acetylcholinesterase-like [Haemaphysalis longicornis]